MEQRGPGRPPVLRGEIAKNPVGAPVKVRPSDDEGVHEFVHPCRATVYWKDLDVSPDEVNCQGYTVSNGLLRFVTRPGEQVIPIENVRKIVTVRM